MKVAPEPNWNIPGRPANGGTARAGRVNLSRLMGSVFEKRKATKNMKSLLKPDIDDDWVLVVMRKGRLYRIILMFAAFGLLLVPINMMWTLSRSQGDVHPDSRAPLGNVYYLILGQDESIYISSFGGVVQKFDHEGVFIYRAPVPQLKGVYSIEKGHNRGLHIKSGIREYVIDSTGAMVQVLDIPYAVRKSTKHQKNARATSEEGNQYLVTKDWFTSRSKVILITNETGGDGKPLIVDPAYFAFLQFTPASLFIIALSCLKLYGFKIKYSTTRTPEPADAGSFKLKF